jgi:hypothetical protein
VHAALSAGVPLNDRVGVYDFELICIFADAELVSRHYGDLRKQRTFRLPAFSASADTTRRRDGFDKGAINTGA